MKMIDFIGAPDPLLSAWRVGYMAGRLVAAPRKNPYYDPATWRFRPGEAAKGLAWEDGRRLGIEEIWLSSGTTGAPRWTTYRMERPSSGLRPV